MPSGSGLAPSPEQPQPRKNIPQASLLGAREERRKHLLADFPQAARELGVVSAPRRVRCAWREEPIIATVHERIGGRNRAEESRRCALGDGLERLADESKPERPGSEQVPKIGGG